jgi:phospholipase C
VANPKVVILCLENRSFDGCFGMRGDAVGCYDPDATPGVFDQVGFTEQDVVQPFRASTFSTIGECLGEYGVFWPGQQLAWNYGAMDSW